MVNYRNSRLSEKASTGKFSLGVPRSGDRFPSVEFLNNGRMTNIFEKLDTTNFSLLVMANAQPYEFKNLAIRYHLTIETIPLLPENKDVYKILGIRKTGYYLVRPDMHIALRSATLDSSHLAGYLERFLT